MNYDIKVIENEINTFSQERDWDQFHNPKDLAIALSVEASELLEIFLWKKAEDADKEKIKEELADVFNYAFLLASKCGFDIAEIIHEKIVINAKKYQVEKSKGKSTKYDKL